MGRVDTEMHFCSFICPHADSRVHYESRTVDFICVVSYMISCTSFVNNGFIVGYVCVVSSARVVNYAVDCRCLAK